ncbi:MAG TPA: tetraacyldisaccharide 4'-kinase [Kiritimatiellae bacterium]|nr:tetraacyldisaccharide 4'-kinase [Kiritimatiellia bacterium]
MQTRLERLETYLLSVIQDRRRGRIAAFLRFVLSLLSHLYAVGVQIRLWLYEHGLFRHHALGCQVLSVGNLTVGGTGKTPIVETFARSLQQQGRRVAILSRGYKSVKPPLWERLLRRLTLADRRAPPLVVSDGKRLLLDSAAAGDEPYMLASNLPRVAVLVDPNRVKSGRYAIQKLGCDTLILDDGFQYLALKHRLDIVLVDRTNPFGNGRVLPRGILREPVRNIVRAGFIFITKSDGCGAAELKHVLRRYNTTAELAECRHHARYLQDVYTQARIGLDYLQDRPVATICGIAVPEGFEEEIRRLGARIVHRRRCADHHRYSQQEIIDMINESLKAGAEAVVTTEKDAVRFPMLERRDIPIYFLRVEIELLSGQENFDQCIARICFHSARARSDVPDDRMTVDA